LKELIEVKNRNEIELLYCHRKTATSEERTGEIAAEKRG